MLGNLAMLVKMIFSPNPQPWPGLCSGCCDLCQILNIKTQLSVVISGFIIPSGCVNTPPHSQVTTTLTVNGMFILSKVNPFPALQFHKRVTGGLVFSQFSGPVCAGSPTTITRDLDFFILCINGFLALSINPALLGNVFLGSGALGGTIINTVSGVYGSGGTAIINI